MFLARFNHNRHTVVHIAASSEVGLLGERAHRMFHTGHVIFESPVGEVGHKEIQIGMPIFFEYVYLVL